MNHSITQLLFNNNLAISRLILLTHLTVCSCTRAELYECITTCKINYLMFNYRNFFKQIFSDPSFLPAVIYKEKYDLVSVFDDKKETNLKKESRQVIYVKSLAIKDIKGLPYQLCANNQCWKLLRHQLSSLLFQPTSSKWYFWDRCV